MTPLSLTTMHPFGGTPICPRCSKAVYLAEQVRISLQIYIFRLLNFSIGYGPWAQGMSVCSCRIIFAQTPFAIALSQGSYCRNFYILLLKTEPNLSHALHVLFAIRDSTHLA